MSAYLAEPCPSSSRSALAENNGELEQDADFWFADGSIILIAENTAFRVHQGVLSRHSEVFRDLFTVPQPDGEQYAYGCPVVCLYDSPVDLRYLLRVLYDGLKHSVKHEPRLEFSEVEALVRLAHKHQLDGLRAEALERLKAVFTDNFTIYSTRDELPLLLRPSDAISVVKLAHLTQELTLLPLALYQCAMLDATQLLEGVPLANGMIDNLSHEDLVRCINGKAILAHKCAMAFSRVFALASSECVSRSLCTSTLSAVQLRVLKMLSLRRHMHALICQCMCEELDKLRELGHLCEKCHQFMYVTHLEGRQQVWMELPSDFGLGDWSQLRDAGVAM
ncbi:hypothetical protein BKA93DRAFT_728331 [Sparassis latifolia]